MTSEARRSPEFFVGSAGFRSVSLGSESCTTYGSVTEIGLECLQEMDLAQVQSFEGIKDWLVCSEVGWTLNSHNVLGPSKLLHALLIW